MRICENGIYRDMTEREIAEMKANMPIIPYEQRIVNRIREKYSVDDELAILRQRESKPDEFAAYNDFVEGIKREERGG
ncbi:MAG: hypothetical protein IIW73_04415 [Clostridia bacterium]|nr:hypothetical protein [Clostridia bacterium]